MLKDPDVIRVLLARLIAARCPVFVFVEGDDERYATTLLELDADANALIADELNPRRGNANVRRGAKLRVAARLEGVDMRFSTRVRQAQGQSVTRSAQAQFSAAGGTVATQFR